MMKALFFLFCLLPLAGISQPLLRNSATTNALPEVRALDITGQYGPITSSGKIEGSQLSVNNSSLWNLTTDGTDLLIAGFNIPLPTGFRFGLDDALTALYYRGNSITIGTNVIALSGTKLGSLSVTGLLASINYPVVDPAFHPNGALVISNSASFPALSLYGGGTSGGIDQLLINGMPTAADVIVGTLSFGAETTNASRTPARIQVGSAAAWTDASPFTNASYIKFLTTPLNSSTLTERMRISSEGIVTVSAPTNGVAPPTSVSQPLGLFGCLHIENTTNVITVGSAGTYYRLTNFTTVATNGFAVARTNGFLTNLVAGFYRVTMYASVISGASDTLEGEFFTGETGQEEVSFFGSFDAPARVRTMSSTGIVYLPANTPLSMRLNNRTDNDNITVWRAALTVGTP